MSFEDDLSAVEEHVAEARRMVQRQKGLMVRLGTTGVSTLDAQSLAVGIEPSATGEP
jgi:hypothetical protein